MIPAIWKAASTPSPLAGGTRLSTRIVKPVGARSSRWKTRASPKTTGWCKPVLYCPGTLAGSFDDELVVVALDDLDSDVERQRQAQPMQPDAEVGDGRGEGDFDLTHRTRPPEA